MKSEKISVIVPVYNLAGYLHACVESILNQTHQNLEIILVDDGSTDASRQIINELCLQDGRIVAIYKENGGVTSARLAGAKAATGEWIGFVDGDDEIEPDMYEFLLKNAIESQAQISHCGYRMVFPDGRVNFFYNTGLRAKHDKVTALKELLSGSKIEPGLWNKLFHKSLFHSLLHTDLMDPSIKINEDLLMNYLLFRQAECSVYEDRCPYHYVVRVNSASRQRLNHHKIYDPIRVKQIIMDDAAPDIRDAAKCAYMITCINVFNALVCEKEIDFQKEKKDVRGLIVQNYEMLALVPAKTKFLGQLISCAPWVYPAVYRLYVKYFQKNRYV